MVNERRTASCLGLEKEESEEMNKPFTVVSTTNSQDFSESGWWGTMDLCTIIASIDSSLFFID